MPRTVEPVNTNPAVLVWARTSCALSIEDAAEHSGVDPARLVALERGESLPGLSELRDLARVYRRPLTVLLLPEPPEEQPFPTDFRTVGGRQPVRSRDVALALRQARRLQLLITRLLTDDPSLFPSAELDRATIDQNAEQSAERARIRLVVSVNDQLAWPQANAAFGHWRARLQSLGILTLVEPMPREDCRGFALWHQTLVPTIVVSGDESDVAKSFTALHEYGHLILRTDSACLESEDESPRGRTERWCNRFAASVLVPSFAVERAAGALSLRLSDLTDLGSLARAAQRLKVSRHVLALRLEALGIAGPGFYDRIKSSLAEDGARVPPAEGREARIPPERRKLFEVGFGAALAILTAWRQGELDTLDTAESLNLSAERLESLSGIAESTRSNYA